MGERNHDRQIRDARSAYDGATQRFLRALVAWQSLGVPLDPGTLTEPVEWGRQDISALLTLHQTLGEMIEKRRALDRIRRELRPPH